MIRVELPQHLRTLARVDGDVTLTVCGPVSVDAVLDALETRYPMLRGTLRHHDGARRRPMIRVFANKQDITHESWQSTLPEAIVSGRQPLRIVGAIAGG
jgi:sulfur-carrier protein